MWWLIQEWPHSRALGKRWYRFPMHVPPDDPWPKGSRFFNTCKEAENACHEKDQ
jgi:hypothetical protein